MVDSDRAAKVPLLCDRRASAHHIGLQDLPFDRIEALSTLALHSPELLQSAHRDDGFGVDESQCTWHEVRVAAKVAELEALRVIQTSYLCDGLNSSFQGDHDGFYDRVHHVCRRCHRRCHRRRRRYLEANNDRFEVDQEQ